MSICIAWTAACDLRTSSEDVPVLQPSTVQQLFHSAFMKVSQHDDNLHAGRQVLARSQLVPPDHTLAECQPGIDVRPRSSSSTAQQLPLSRTHRGLVDLHQTRPSHHTSTFAAAHRPLPTATFDCCVSPGGHRGCAQWRSRRLHSHHHVIHQHVGEKKVSFHDVSPVCPPGLLAMEDVSPSKRSPVHSQRRCNWRWRRHRIPSF